VTSGAAHAVHSQFVGFAFIERVMGGSIPVRFLMSHGDMTIGTSILNYIGEFGNFRRFASYKRLPEWILCSVRHHRRSPLRGLRNVDSGVCGIGDTVALMTENAVAGSAE